MSINKDGGGTIRLIIRDPMKLTVNNITGQTRFECGAQSKVRRNIAHPGVSYLPLQIRQPVHVNLPIPRENIGWRSPNYSPVSRKLDRARRGVRKARKQRVIWPKSCSSDAP